VSLALYVIFLCPFYNLVKFVGGIYNTGRYIPYEIEILHICCNTLFLCYNIRNLNLFLYIYFDRALQSTVHNISKSIKVLQYSTARGSIIALTLS
jgi:hypothetical protein